MGTTLSICHPPDGEQRLLIDGFGSPMLHFLVSLSYTKSHGTLEASTRTNQPEGSRRFLWYYGTCFIVSLAVWYHLLFDGGWINVELKAPLSTSVMDAHDPVLGTTFHYQALSTLNFNIHFSFQSIHSLNFMVHFIPSVSNCKRCTEMGAK